MTAGHRTGQRTGHATRSSGEVDESYRSLFRIAVDERSRVVCAVAVQEIGRGGSTALHQLQPHFASWWRWWRRYWADPEQVSEQAGAYLEVVTARDEPRRRLHDLVIDRGAGPAEVPAADSTAARSRPDGERTGEVVAGINLAARHARICAALAPLLYRPPTTLPVPDGLERAEAPQGPVDHGAEACEEALTNLRCWVNDYLPAVDPRRPSKRSWISLEIALSGGFRQAANHRPRQRDSQWRATMIDLAETALKNSRFWYAQLTLVQALTLLSLPDDPAEPLADRGHGADPHGLVRYWLSIAGTGCVDVAHRTGHHIHPFVVEAGRLAEQALVTRQPERFCWIDELDTAQRIGCGQQSELFQFPMWVLDTAGWSGLDIEARQLLGDVIVLLQLTTRGELDQNSGDNWNIEVLEDKLARSDRPDIPPCLIRDRAPLDVTRTIARATTSEPGSNCYDDCPFRLCPYPPRGQLPYQVELGEGFCRELQHGRHRPRYAGRVTRTEYTGFWQDMAARVRPSTSRSALARINKGNGPTGS